MFLWCGGLVDVSAYSFLWRVWMQNGLVTLVEYNSTPQPWLEKPPVALRHPFRS